MKMQKAKRVVHASMLKCGAMEVADAILNGDYGRPTNTHVDVIKEMILNNN